MADVASQLDAMAEQAQRRLRLSSLLDDTAGDGADHKAQRTALCVSRTLFGHTGAPDDDGGSPAESGFFAGNVDDYYDMRNSFLPDVLRRKQGIPISLSLVYIGTRAAGLPMVGLNAPRIARRAVGRRSRLPSTHSTAPFSPPKPPNSRGDECRALRHASQRRSARRRRMMAELRERPMTSHAWVARMLRNLRQIHSASGDVVRTLGWQAPTPRRRHEAGCYERCRLQCVQVACASSRSAGRRRDEAREIILTHLPRPRQTRVASGSSTRFLV